MEENLQKKKIEREKEETLSKIHCANRKNTIRSNQYVQEHTPRISSEIANLFKNLLLGLEFII